MDKLTIKNPIRIVDLNDNKNNNSIFEMII